MNHIFLIALLQVVLAVFCVAAPAKGPISKGISSQGVVLDFVETPLVDVARAISLGYDTPILVDNGLDIKVTFHLEGVGLIEGVAALCEANGLSLVQEGQVYHIRRPVDHGIHEFYKEDGLVSVSVRDKLVGDFVREYALNSGLNILANPGVSGVVTGELHHMEAEAAFRVLMKANGFHVWREGDCLRVDVPVEKNQVGQSGIGVERDGNLYSLECNGGSLGDVLRSLADAASLNLALYGEIREEVRLKFERVPLEELLRVLFRGRRYSYVMDDSSLLVSEGGSRRALSDTRLVALKHVNCEKAMGYFAKFMPSESFAVTEIREQNGLLLGGTPAELEMGEALLRLIDVPAIQVTLSCIIVELKRGRNFEIGFHSGSMRKTAANDIGARGYFDFLGKDFSRTGAFGKVGLLPDRFEMELASMEENNQGKVLARPRLTTLNGNKAELNVTNTVYYLVSQVSADGYPITDYRSFNDGISLEITPSVTLDGNITLEVSPEIKTAGRSTGDGPRDISTRNLKTVVVLKDGESLCLGGLIRKNKTEVRSAIPFLGSIPLIGRLFSYVSEEEEENELAIFITPRVEKHLRGP